MTLADVLISLIGDVASTIATSPDLGVAHNLGAAIADACAKIKEVDDDE